MVESMAESSIIIVTYNGLQENTIPCLESILHHGGDENFEIIVVDNNSSDGTPAYLTGLANREPRLKHVLNNTNRGFAGGNNDGIRIASGKIIVLLNSDTQVSEGWLSRLRATLLEDRSVGLVGPVSNAVGNEQKILVSGSTPEETLREGRTWTEMSYDDCFETERLGFFCVALRRDVIDCVGILDEAYDLGFYEDDDYCLRVLKAGYRLICREDVFVYHRGSASFNKNPAATKQLLKKNRHHLETKFGITYRPRHPRDRQLELIESYLGQNNRKSDEQLQYKLENRLQLVYQSKPRSLIKKLRFFIRMSRIRKLKTLLPFTSTRNSQ